jgi:hypothetical protein
MDGMVPIVLIVVGVGALFYSLIAISYYVGGKDDYSSLQPMLTSIAITNLIGTILLMVGMIVYFKSNPALANIFAIGISGVAVFFSMTAVSVSVLGKVYS